MKSLKRAWLQAFPIVLLMTGLIGVLSGQVSWAFITSDEGIWRADIDEGKRRAQDFKDHLRRERQAEEAREQAGPDYAEERRERQARHEMLREEFIAERDARPDEEVERVRLEKEYEAQQAAREKEAEAHRKAYVANRALVRKVLVQEAYIDEMLEYELVESPETK